MSDAENKIDTDDGVEVNIEIVDDTPERDRGKFIAPEKTDNDADITVPDDEISRYKDDIQKRIKDLTFKAHSERRAKEQAAREREEAVRFAQQIIEENKRLKQHSVSSEVAMVDQARVRAEAQINMVKKAAKDAFEAGDTDKFLDLQEQLQRHVTEHERFSAYRPPAVEVEVEQPRFEPKIPKPDAKAESWYQNNQWFQSDGDLEQEMTAYAFGVSDILINKRKVDPSTDEYYEEINKSVRRRFPEYFRQQTPEPEVDVTARVNPVVAPATRSVKTASTVRLSPSQVRLARRLGLTLEQYASQLSK